MNATPVSGNRNVYKVAKIHINNVDYSGDCILVLKLKGVVFFFFCIFFCFLWDDLLFVVVTVK